MKTMRKTAQGNPLEIPYGQGSLAGYGQPSYDQSMDNLALLPGIEPVQQESYPAGPSNWTLPAGLAAGGLIASMLLRKGGGRLAAAGKSLRPAATAATTAARTGPLMAEQIQHLTHLSKYEPQGVSTAYQAMLSKLPRP